MTINYKRLIADAWRARRDAQGLKPGSMKEARAQLEFIIGATVGVQAATEGEIDLSMMALLVSTGRDCVVEWGSPTTEIAT